MLRRIPLVLAASALHVVFLHGSENATASHIAPGPDGLYSWAAVNFSALSGIPPGDTVTAKVSARAVAPGFKATTTQGRLQVATCWTSQQGHKQYWGFTQPSQPASLTQRFTVTVTMPNVGGTWRLSTPSEAASCSASFAIVAGKNPHYNGAYLADDTLVWEADATHKATISYVGVGTEYPPYPLAGGSIPEERRRGDCGEGGPDGNADPFSRCMADPVNSGSGAFTTTVADVSLPGSGVPFDLVRSYSSSTAQGGPLGQGWTHTFDTKLIAETGGHKTLQWGSGQRLRYTLLPSGAFSAPAAVRSTLMSVAGGYELSTPDFKKYKFDSAGKLTEIADRNGNAIVLTTDDASGYLATVTDTAGRIIAFTHNGSGLLTDVDLPDGRSINYGYTSGRLTSVTDLRGKTWAYAYDAGGRLTTITDPELNTTIENTYNGDGRVVEQRDALENVTTFSYEEAPNESFTTTMTDARGKVWKDIYSQGVLVERIDPELNETAIVRGDDLRLQAVPKPGGSAWNLAWDASGNLASRTAVAPFGYEESYAYDSSSRLTSHTDALDRTTTYDYDTDGNLTTITEPGALTTTITRDTTTGLPTAVQDARGKVWTYDYDEDGNLTLVLSPLGAETTMTYDSRGFMTSRTDPRGNEPGTDPADYTTTFTYDAAANVLTETNPLGGVTTNTYNDAGRLASRTDARGKTTSYEYNAAGEVTKVIAPDSGETTYTYDESGNLLSETDAEGGQTSYTYDDAGRLATKTDPRGKTWTYTHDATGALTSETSPLGNETTYAYDILGRLSSRVDPRGNAAGANPSDFTWSFDYDGTSNLTETTDPLGNTTASTFDHRGRVLTETDPANKTSTYAYDPVGNLLTTEDPLDNITTNAYDDDGRLSSTTDPRGKTTTFARDEAGNLTATTTPLGFKETLAYDALNRITSRTDPRGNVTGATPADFTATYTYDPVGNLLSETDALAKTTSYTYDDVSHRITKTDALNRTTSYDYDLVGHMTSLLAPDAALTSYAYDDAGNLVSRTDANNHTTTFAFDDDGRQISETTPLGKIRSYGYDEDGNQTTEVDPRGNATPTSGDGTITSTYDRAGRLTGIDYSDATPDVTFTYDARGLRTQMTDGAGTETRAYDDGGRLTSITRGTTVISYLYDAASNVTRRTYPGGATVDLAYDDDGRLATVAQAAGSATYAYDAAANQTGLTRPNNTSTAWAYDRVGRPLEIAHKQGAVTFARFAYTYDDVGNPTDVDTPEGLISFTYDAQDRLTSACYAPSCPAPLVISSIAYTYDAVGNRLTETRPTSSTTYTYDADDQLTTSVGTSGTTAYTYDAAGNQTAAGTRTFTYDLASRTDSIADPGPLGTTRTYAYDGDGKRRSAATPSQTTNYTWDPNRSLPEVLEERDGTNNLIRRHVQGNELLSETTPSSTSWTHGDSLGSVVSVTDAAGDRDWSYAYEPFGAERVTVQRDLLAPAQPMRFTGQHVDPTGLYHLRARQYDPSLGRFTARDPMPPLDGAPLVASHVYANSGPTVLVDPAGLRGRSLGGGFWPLAGFFNPATVPALKDLGTAIGKAEVCASAPYACAAIIGFEFGRLIHEWNPGNYSAVFEEFGGDVYDYFFSDNEETRPHPTPAPSPTPSPTPVPGDDQTNTMRFQVQWGTGKGGPTFSEVQRAPSDSGVTVSQAVGALRRLSAKVKPSRAQDASKRAIERAIRFVRSAPPHGVSGTDSRSFDFDYRDFNDARVDVENRRGWNLRR